MLLDIVLARLRPFFERLDQPVYLVGGAARDKLLGRPCHDLDFVVPERAIKLAFQTADFLGLPAYILDKERDTGRVVLPDGATLDFARFRGPDLEADLRDRDFTVNAMALLATADDELIDPCDGRRDLELRLIRQTHSEAIAQDTVRALRAARQAAELEFAIDLQTAATVTAVAPQLVNASVERVRDELIKLLAGRRADRGVRLLWELGLLAALLPEIVALEPVTQSAPHHEPVLAHTLRVMRWLLAVETAVVEQQLSDIAALRLAQIELAAYAPQLQAYLRQPMNGGLTRLTALRLAALFHDAGKAQTRTVDVDGRIRFFGHDEVGAQITADRLRQLRLSKEMAQAAAHIVDGHMRPLLLSESAGVNRRSAYRFFRAYGDEGAAIVLLSLADSLATYDADPAQGPPVNGAWTRLLKVAGALCETYFVKHEVGVRPRPLLDGRELMAHFGLKPGPEVGRLLALIEEAQAAGEIGSVDEALALVQEKRSANSADY
jgi:putative nucleotidyltransferase with HDIG domain